MKFTFDSVRKFFKSLSKAERAHAKAFETGIKVTALYIQRESQKIVPVDTGVLRNSAGTMAEGKGWETVVSIFYTAQYAVYVHEILTSYHAPPTRAKYLESVLEEKKKEIQMVFDKACQDALRGSKYV